MGVYNNGSYYGIPADLIYSLPVTIGKGGEWSVVPGLTITDFAREKMDLTAKELVDERDTANQFVQPQWQTARGMSTDETKSRLWDKVLSTFMEKINETEIF